MAPKNNKPKPAKKPRLFSGLGLGITIFSPLQNGTANPDPITRNLTVNGWVGLVTNIPPPTVTVWFLFNNTKLVSPPATLIPANALPNPNWTATIPGVPQITGGFDCTLFARAQLPDPSSGNALFDVVDSIVVHIN
jgi:hypothetical protein